MTSPLIKKLRRRLENFRRQAKRNHLVEWQRHYDAQIKAYEDLLPVIEGLQDRLDRAEETIDYLVREKDREAEQVENRA